MTSIKIISENDVSNRRSAHHQDTRSDMNGNLSLMVGSVDLTCSKSRSNSPDEENDINVNDWTAEHNTKAILILINVLKLGISIMVYVKWTLNNYRKYIRKL